MILSTRPLLWRDISAIIVALPISYVVVCIFSALHDTIHESGHGVMCRSRGLKVQISLGSFQCREPVCSDESSVWSVEARGELFFRPLYRTSSTCCSDPCQDPGSLSKKESLIFMGGLFGLLGMWLICVIMCCFAIMVVPRLALKPATNSCFALYLLRSAHIMAFLPEFWIIIAPLPLCARWSVLFTCCFTQLDLLNELFYAFTPSRTVVGEWEPSFDGVRQWMVWTGVPPNTMNPQTTSPIVRDSLWAVLLLLYVVHAARYIRLAILLQRGDISQNEVEGEAAGARAQGVLAGQPDPAQSVVGVEGGLDEMQAPGTTPSSETSRLLSPSHPILDGQVVAASLA
jgi:hypothetical protein